MFLLNYVKWCEISWECFCKNLVKIEICIFYSMKDYIREILFFFILEEERIREKLIVWISEIIWSFNGK